MSTGYVGYQQSGPKHDGCPLRRTAAAKKVAVSQAKSRDPLTAVVYFLRCYRIPATWRLVNHEVWLPQQVHQENKKAPWGKW